MWWSGKAFAATSQTFVGVSGTTTWLLPLGASNLTSGDAYSVIAQATDSLGNVGTSSTVTFTYTPQPTVAITYPVDGTTYGSNWTGTITGTASPGAGATVASTAVAIEDTSTTMWWNGTSFASSTQTFGPVTGTTTWLLPLGTGNLTSGDSYSLVAEATDSAGNLGTSSSVSSTYFLRTTTAPPTLSITYPVDHTTYGADWTGTITGTASSNSGASTTIASTEVAIEDTTASQWWKGSSFSASSQTFVPVSGTTTWMLGLGPNNLTSGDSYSVVAKATDSTGNLGTSSAVTFTYGSTTTTSTTTTSTTTTSTTTTSTTTTTTPTVSGAPDSTTTTVSESPTSVTYGNESASQFTASVTTTNGEAVPSGDTITVNAGTASCTVTLPATTCSIGDTDLGSGGPYAVSATYNSDANLSTSTGTASIGLTVEQASLTVTASSTTSSYGTVPTVTASYSGFVNGETNTVLTTVASCSSTVTATTAVGTYTGANTCSGGAATNYSFAYEAGDATVDQDSTTTTSSATVTAS
jgi:hypothetical protein